MKVVLIADAFPPLRTSGAVQLRDLSREFARQGHSWTILLPQSDQQESCRLEEFDGTQVLRLKAPRTKDINYVRRTLGELIMPFAMLHHLRKSPLANERWDGVVWYTPSIFHSPLASALKKSSGCKGYLIVRDIFPEWAVDLGIMGRGLPYRFFDAVARYQYSVADVIGVQTSGNLGYFERWQQQPGRRLEVLQNWLDKPAQTRCSIRVDETPLAGRKVLVYAGNMGVAQGMDILLDLAKQRQLMNVVFFDEIHPDEIPDLYSQCSAGIVALDPRHKSHNIPGKFLTYVQSGLPVLAYINAGNDLADLIRTEEVGRVSEGGTVEQLEKLTLSLVDHFDANGGMQERCRALYLKQFSVEKAVHQIVAALGRS